jgi:hypothetical protein
MLLAGIAAVSFAGLPFFLALTAVSAAILVAILAGSTAILVAILAGSAAIFVAILAGSAAILRSVLASSTARASFLAATRFFGLLREGRKGAKYEYQGQQSRPFEKTSPPLHFDFSYFIT